MRRTGPLKDYRAAMRAIFLSVLCMAAGVASHSVSAQDLAFKAVYRDPNFGTNWNDNAVADKVTAYFQAAGYEVLDAARLRPWLNARIGDRQRAVLVNSHDTFPDSALDPVGAGLLPSANNPIRRFLLSGGRIVHYGDIPFYLHATGPIATSSGWASDGGTKILGRAAASGTWDLQKTPIITTDGALWGISENIQSNRPTAASNVDIILSQDEQGQASAWIQKFTNVPGRGEFIRLADTDLSAGSVTDQLLADLKRVAEYTPADAVTGTLAGGLEGAISLDGAPYAARDLPIRDDKGQLAAIASTDADGHYLIYLQPGNYVVDYGVNSPYGGVNPPEVSVALGAVSQVPLLRLLTLPTLELTKEGGFQWLAYLDPQVGGTANYSSTGLKEDNFIPWNVTATNGNWTTDLLDGRGIANGEMHGWLRLHIKPPADWSANRRGNLRLYGFNFDAVDETFFNGIPIGKKGRFPEEEGGTVKDPNTIRAYTIPTEIVNWDGDNVLAIHGYHDGAAGAFTLGLPRLTATGTGGPPPGRGDLNGDGKIGIADAILSLQISVGLISAMDQNDVNLDEQQNIADTTLILAYAVGNIKAFPAGVRAIKVEIVNSAFKPRSIIVARGATVTWVNRDAATHVIRSGSPGSPDGKFSSDAVAQDFGFIFTFTEPGTYSYYLEDQPTSTGTVFVE